MEILTRRKFLSKASLASTSLFIPTFLQESGCMVDKGVVGNNNGKNIVVIQLSGGNDGLNTVIPFENDFYYNNRPKIAIKSKEILKLNNELAFNPVMTGMKSLYDDGLMSVINNVGYPNPNRSHFRAMDIWQTGSSSKDMWTTGWLGRYLDNYCSGCEPYVAFDVSDTLSQALKGAKKNGIASGDLKKLNQQLKNLPFNTNLNQHNHEHENVAYLYKTLGETKNSAAYLYEKSQVFKSNTTYPNTLLAKRLKRVTALIMSDAGVKIYYVNIGGFDTHVNQNNRQGELLKMTSDAVATFVKDLKRNNLLDNTLVMMFSEFGRRVKENGSKGTDHGTANNLYLIGSKLTKAGVYNDAPDLKNLVDGDLKFSVDFRRVYTSVLENWLDVDAQPILKEDFEPLSIIRKS